MKIASAQIESQIGNLQGNLKNHLELIKIAAQNKVDLIAFPEMSLTGYCREEGETLAMTKSDNRLNSLKKSATENNLIIIAGAPIKVDKKIFIGSFVFMPNGETDIYTKQFLHEGEEIYYSSSFDFNPIIKIKEEIIAFAICADIDHPEHPQNAKANNCTIYIPGIFFSKNGITEGHKKLANYAAKNSFVILMSNFCGSHWNTEAGGRSAFWDKTGKMTTELDGDHSGLLIAEKIEDSWNTKIVIKKTKEVH